MPPLQYTTSLYKAPSEAWLSKHDAFVESLRRPVRCLSLIQVLEPSALPRNLSLYVNKSTFTVGGDPHFGRMRTIPHWICERGRNRTGARGSAAYPFCIIRSCELYQLSYPPLCLHLRGIDVLSFLKNQRTSQRAGVGNNEIIIQIK